MEATLAIRHAGCYTSQLTLDYPVRITVLSGHTTPEGSVGLWELSGPNEDLPQAFAALAAHPNIRRADALQKRNGAWILETVDTEAEVSNALIHAGLVFLPPVMIADGLETYRVFALDRKQVDRAVRALRGKNEVRVLAARERVAGIGALASLTEKQRASLELAVREGYYARPKRTDLDKLARAMRVSRPTFAEHLARAEGKVLGSLVGE